MLCCTQPSFQCPTEDGFSASLTKCPLASQLHLRVILGPSSSFSFETAWNSSARFLHLAEKFLDCHYLRFLSPARLPSSCRCAVRQVWSLILQRDGKRSAEYTEQRYRVARSLAHSPVEARGENEDLCETITRGGKIRPRRYHSDTDRYSRAETTDEKIYSIEMSTDEKKRESDI